MTTRIIRIYLFLMLALGVTACIPSQAQGGVDILLAQARSLEARGRMDLAVGNWRKVLLVNPNQTEALAGLARGAKQNGQTEEERSYLDRLRKINPGDPQIAQVEKLHVFTPEERNRLDEAGRLAMQHKPDEAMKIYHQVLGDQLPPPGKWAGPFYETEAASNGGREKAISQLRQLCAQNPNQEAYRLWLASQLTYDPKTRKEGIRLFESIKDPGTVEQARAPWRQALLWEKDNPDVLAPIEAYLQRYPDPDLQPIAESLRAKQQQNIADADEQRAFEALRNKDTNAAAAEFTDVLRRSPNDADAIAGLAFARLDQKRFSEALSLFDHARALAPQRQDVRDGYDSAKFWLAIERGASAQQQNQPAAAIAGYREALTLRPLDIGAQLGMANALVKEHKYSDAEARFQQVLRLSPNNADAMAGLGFVRLNQGRFDDAEKLFAETRKLNPARKDVDEGYHNAAFWGIMNRAAGALNQNRPKDAVAEYQRAVSLNPNDKDALLGLAHAFVRAGDFPTAAKTFYRLTAANPTDEVSWLGLIQAQLGEKDPQAAITTSQRIPPATKQKMETRSDYLSEMALIFYNANQPNEGDQALRRAMVIAKNSDTEDALGLRLQIAGAFMDQGNLGGALEIFRQAVQSHPDEANGWEGLVGIYTRMHDLPQAIAAVRSMPARSYDAAVKQTGFLNSLAVLYSAQGQCGEAEDFLNRSLGLDQAERREPAEGTKLQLADIWMREHNYDRARQLYQEIVATNPDSADAWRGFLVALHQQRADRTLVAEIPHVPIAVRDQLETDSSFLILEASAQSTAGQSQEAVQLLQKARLRYTSQHKNPPIDLDIQLAWTMLSVSFDEPGLSEQLLSTKKRTDLTSKERQAIEEIWSTWSVRRADRAFAQNPQLAISILTDAGNEYPGDRNIHAALASLYLQRNEKQNALSVYQTWGMRGAQAGDYRVAAGAALSAHKNEMADQFLKRGLDRFPNDPELMHMIARQAILSGNYDEGERELKSALQAMRDQDTSQSRPKPQALMIARENANDSAGNVSTIAANGGANQASNSLSSAPPCRAVTASGTPGDPRIRPISLVLRMSSRQYYSADGQQTGAPETGDQAGSQQRPKEQQIQDEIETVDNRNTPVISTGGTGTGRVGDPGFDQLIISDSLLGAAFTASDRVRLGVEGHGVYLNSGTPDGSSSLMFGTLPANAAFDQQSAIGVAGVAQLSTDTFGLAVGTTPQGFRVHNLTGGVRYRPLDGWFTFLGVRDTVKDSLLSYAGVRDPGTGAVWGGVVSNTGTVQFNSAPSTNVRYKTIGEYASASYSFIQGKKVPDNWSMAGDAGLYWRVMQNLTVGANAGAMHYDKNLKFFSFGQGGYFSPQQYYLGSVPISWYSRHPRFEYEIKASAGLQYLHEDGSPFYPTSTGAAVVTPGSYASNNTTAPNYNVDLRLGYRVAPHVFLDTLATANNARDYYTQSVGFNLKFTFDRIPTSTDLRVNAIPDWTGKQPFAVR
jgi:tetratricopeptide (TPR) repeat protein